MNITSPEQPPPFYNPSLISQSAALQFTFGTLYKMVRYKTISDIRCLKMDPKSIIGLDKRGYQVNIFLIFQQKHMLWYSLEAPHRGASNKYPQHMFSLKNKKNIDTFWLKKVPYQEL